MAALELGRARGENPLELGWRARFEQRSTMRAPPYPRLHEQHVAVHHHRQPGQAAEDGEEPQLLAPRARRDGRKHHPGLQHHERVLEAVALLLVQRLRRVERFRPRLDLRQLRLVALRRGRGARLELRERGGQVRPSGSQRALHLQPPGADVPLDRFGLVVAPLIAGFRLGEDGVRELVRVRARGDGRQHRQHRGRARDVVRPPPARGFGLRRRRFRANLVCGDRHGGNATAAPRPGGSAWSAARPGASVPFRTSGAATMQEKFGRYELLKRLAGGGMGEVYLARQRGIDGFQKLLVIKTLLPHLCEDEEFITMFKDEARVTAQLIHPNICQVFEFDQVGGVYYMCMEYLRGEDLRVPLICRIIADAASGLDFAHRLRDAKGEPYHIVHRDISPQNILVTFEGGVKIIDFGVAKAAGRAQHTRTGALKGKCSYMSPEQAAGATVDGRSDIFALGIVLHELLTGRRLFKAEDDVQTLARVRECRVPPPSQLDPGLPPDLDPIVLKALAKDPAARYAGAQELG